MCRLVLSCCVDLNSFQVLQETEDPTATVDKLLFKESEGSFVLAKALGNEKRSEQYLLAAGPGSGHAT